MKRLAIIPLLLILTACASLGLAPASSFEERLAYAVSQNAAVRSAAAVSLERNEIALEDAQLGTSNSSQRRPAAPPAPSSTPRPARHSSTPAIRQAQAEGRALTREELQAAFDQDDDARDRLVAAIEAAS